MDAFQDAIVRAAGPTPPDTATGSAPLSRRTPGASLAPSLRDAPGGTPARRTAGPHRDPEAERSRFDGYAASLAEARRQVGREPAEQDPLPPRTKES